MDRRAQAACRDLASRASGTPPCLPAQTAPYLSISLSLSMLLWSGQQPFIPQGLRDDTQLEDDEEELTLERLNSRCWQPREAMGWRMAGQRSTGSNDNDREGTTEAGAGMGGRSRGAARASQQALLRYGQTAGSTAASSWGPCLPQASNGESNS